MTPALCFEFCIGKGLDIFGLVEGVECRCGASAVNSHDNGLDISHLQFNPAALTMHLNDMTGCPVRAYRYAGHYEGAGFSNPQGHQGAHPPTTPQTLKYTFPVPPIVLSTWFPWGCSGFPSRWWCALRFD